MTRDEFIKAGSVLFGPHWRARLAVALRVERSTVSRWASGATDVLPVAAVAVELMMRLHELGAATHDTTTH